MIQSCPVDLGWCADQFPSPLLTDVGALRGSHHARPPRRRVVAATGRQQSRLLCYRKCPEQAFLLCFFVFYAPLCSMINNPSGPKTSFSTTGRIHFILSVNVCRCIVLDSSVQLLSTSGFLSAARLPLKEMIHCSGK